MKGINIVILWGNVGEDPRITHTPDGMCIANFQMATNDGWTTNNGRREQRTEWHDITCFEGLAEKIVGTMVKRGSSVLVVGSKRKKRVGVGDEIVANTIRVTSRSGAGGDVGLAVANALTGDKE
jgi:single stranded DNA-binding protein